MDVRHNNNALQELNDCIRGLLHLGLHVITFRTLLHLGPNVITFRTLLHLGQLLHLGLQQPSPAEKKKMKRNERGQTKKELETKMSQNDTAVHLSLRQSYSSRQVHRMALSFETFEEAEERAKTTPPKVRERSHTASPANIEGKLDQLLADVESWPDGPPNWSERARMYNIKTKGSDSTPDNGGQLVKAFLK